MPHYDSEGRRVTRHAASTRAITDEELVDLYLDREAEYFAQRFRSVSGEVMAALGDLDGQVREFADHVSDTLGDVRLSAEEAAATSDESRDILLGIDETTARTLSEVEGIGVTPTMEEAWYQLRHRREAAYARFKFRRQEAQEAAEVLARLFAAMPSVLDYVAVRREFEAWVPFLKIPFDASPSEWHEAAERVWRSREPLKSAYLDLSRERPDLVPPAKRSRSAGRGHRSGESRKSR